MKRTFAVVSLALVMASWLVAPASATDPAQLSSQPSTRSSTQPAICGMQPQYCPNVTELPAKVTLLVGTQATLTLETNVTTGTQWVIVQTPCCNAAGKPFAKVSKGRYTPPAKSMPGAPGTTTWKITGLRPGKGSVIVATRPAGVQNTMQDEEVGELKVTVKKA